MTPAPKTIWLRRNERCGIAPRLPAAAEPGKFRIDEGRLSYNLNFAISNLQQSRLLQHDGFDRVHQVFAFVDGLF